MHHHFRKHRCNGEWFEINFATAFKALLDLKLIPEHEQPHLELPTIPPVHPMFVTWFIATGDRHESWPKEAIEDVKANPESYWHEHHKEFQASLSKNKTLEEMLLADQFVSVEEGLEYFRLMKEQIARKGSSNDSKPL